MYSNYLHTLYNVNTVALIIIMSLGFLEMLFFGTFKLVNVDVSAYMYLL